MSEFFTVIFCLISLYFSQKGLMSQFSRLIHRFGGDRNSLIIFWSIIFLPGTVIHELSHFLFAMLTGARTGKIEVFPRFLEEGFESEDKGGSVTLGYVQTQKLNPFQGVLVGLAPFLVGLALLIWLSGAIQTSYSSSSYYLLFFQGYLFFTISNSFFPSSSDLRHVIPVASILVVLVIISWYFGFLFLPKPSPYLFSLLNTINFTLGISIVLNLFIILLTKLFYQVFKLSK